MEEISLEAYYKLSQLLEHYIARSTRSYSLDVTAFSYISTALTTYN